MSLRVDHLYKELEGRAIFRDFSMTIPEGLISCILGPSGCGKTTLLHIFAGIIAPDSGSILGIEGKRFSYIFQEPRLLPWKTVQGNIEFVLDPGLSPSVRHDKAKELIAKVDLAEFADYYPDKLSGGMRQRVSIARAFASRSDIILMDEPLSGLDPDLKRSMIDWFTSIWRADQRTVIYVTHEAEEAHLLGHEIFTFSKAPVEILNHTLYYQPVQ